MATLRNNKASQNNGQGDYGQNQDYLKKVDHDNDMSALRDRLDKLETYNKDRTAQTAAIKDVLENDRNIDPVMAEYVKSHVDLKPIVQSAVDDMDKRLAKAFMKKTGIWALGGVWSVILIVVTAWVTKKIG